MHKTVSIMLVCLFFRFSGFGQKIEAESGTLAGGAVKKYSSSCSGNYYVAQQDGSLSFSISFDSTAYYNVYVRLSSPAGYKANYLVVDGTSITFSTEKTADFITLKVAGFVKFSAGTHQLQIAKSWGWINIDYLELEKVNPDSRFDINTALVTPNPTDGAKRLYQFLRDNYTKKIISGVSEVKEANWLQGKTGKSPALVGLDFLFCNRGYTWYDDNTPFNQGKDWAARNGIVNFHWHWRDPSRVTEEFYTTKTAFDIRAIFDESSANYKAMIKDIDYVSGQLKRFQDAGIPVIWRPLHEAAGGWFWWGAQGPEACKKLWRVMFDRMVNVNGLKNLIWVWTHQPGDDAWYPGDEYVDIVGIDIYKEGDHSSQVLEFNDMSARYGERKMVTISETGSFPDVDHLIADKAGWSWFMVWNGQFVENSTYNSLDLWKKMFASDYVITLDEMPDLKTYPLNTLRLGLKSDSRKELTVFPTVFRQQVQIESTEKLGTVSVFDLSGKKVCERSPESERTVISLSDCPAGTYLIKADHQKPVKIFKQ